MTRNMIAANQVVFEILDSHSDPERQGGRTADPRWLSSKSSDRKFIKEARYLSSVKFGRSHQIAHFVQGNSSFFFLSGFHRDLALTPLSEIDFDAGHFTTLVLETRLEPVATRLEVYDAVGEDDKASFPEYDGHSLERLIPLFPTTRAFVCLSGVIEEEWRLYFLICLEEVRFGRFWQDEELIDCLAAMSELDSSRIPYRVLCRSVFDLDESSFFLALYRCLEALYSYSASHGLSKRLGVQNLDWRDVARAAEEELGWYAKEDRSIERLFEFASKKELLDLAKELKVELEPINTLAERVARSVYALRNRFVHFRPVHQEAGVKRIDWNRICSAMACIVLDVYHETA